MLQINGKTFMNLQEAVQWLLDNNALPFQSTANYAGNTEIGLGTIVNPSPAKVRIGSLIFFADSKVSTVTGITENGFICSDQYNNLVDDIAYVTSISINASGHLITTLSDGQTIDAGIIKQVSNFSINGSQHLIVSFNDGTSTDLGAIFSGNVNISGNLTADSIIENMSGYGCVEYSSKTAGVTIDYAGIVKNGNKVTMVQAGNYTPTTNIPATSTCTLLDFIIPKAVSSKIVPMGTGNVVAVAGGYLYKDGDYVDNSVPAVLWISRSHEDLNQDYYLLGFNNMDQLDANQKYCFRLEFTFLVSENLAS